MQLLFVNRENGKHVSEIKDAEIRHDIWTQKYVDGELLFENDFVKISSMLYVVRFVIEDSAFCMIPVIAPEGIKQITNDFLEKCCIVGNIWNGLQCNYGYTESILIKRSNP